MNKTLILIRHAHRETIDRELDNGLSGKGRDQAKSLKRFFAGRFSHQEMKQGLWLVSSPKRRCLETLDPIARAVERRIDIHPGLDEQRAQESVASLTERVQRFLHDWSRHQVPLTVVCSHGDWLPHAAHHLLGVFQEVKKGSWLEIGWDSERAFLKWYVPHFRHFYD